MSKYEMDTRRWWHPNYTWFNWVSYTALIVFIMLTKRALDGDDGVFIGQMLMGLTVSALASSMAFFNALDIVIKHRRSARSRVTRYTHNVAPAQFAPLPFMFYERGAEWDYFSDERLK